MFRKLRGKLKEFDIDQSFLAEKLGICSMSVSHKFTGKAEWQLGDMYAVLDLIHEPPEQLNAYFPRGGLTPNA